MATYNSDEYEGSSDEFTSPAIASGFDFDDESEYEDDNNLNDDDTYDETNSETGNGRSSFGGRRGRSRARSRGQSNLEAYSGHGRTRSSSPSTPSGATRTWRSMSSDGYKPRLRKFIDALKRKKQGLRSRIGGQHGMFSKYKKKKNKNGKDERIPGTRKRRITFSLAIYVSVVAIFVMLIPQRHSIKDFMKSQTSNIDLFDFTGSVVESLTSSVWGNAAGAGGSAEEKFANAFNENRPGLKAFKNGDRIQHPVVFFPGFISVALELWDAEPCASGLFRQRMWNTVNVLKYYLSHRECWLRHLSLNRTTGMDPENIRLRPTEGLAAIDYWATEGYFVWAPIIRALADVGANPSDIGVVSYDWRMHPTLMERRDGSLSRAASMIERMVGSTGRKVVLLAHSYGGTVSKYFLSWVESPLGGNRGRGWCDKHIESWVAIGSPSVGVPKAYTALLAGEFRDTADVEESWGNVGSYLTQVLMPSEQRVNLFRSWTCMLAMMPHGGDLLWGGWNKTHPTAHDQDVYALGKDVQNVAYFVTHDQGFEWPEEIDNVTALLRSQIDAAGCGPGTGRNCTMTQAMELLRHVAGDELGNLMDGLVSLGSDDSDLSGLKDPRKWANPLESALPHAPDMKVYCMYGHKEMKSERAYWISATKVPGYLGIDTSKTRGEGETLRGGVVNGDGDETVPLISEGAVCHGLWALPRYNPSNMSVTVVEYESNPLGYWSGGDIQGGGQSAAHVDIMGSVHLITDILKVVSGSPDDRPEEHISTDIKRVSANLVETLNEHQGRGENLVKNKDILPILPQYVPVFDRS